MAAIPPICDFGLTAPDFNLPDTSGKMHGFSDIRGKNGTLVMFICNHCPYVLSVIDRVVTTVNELEAHGIKAVAIMSNDWQAYPADAPEHMATFALQHKFSFPYLVDADQSVAKAYDAVCTPDFFGFNASGELQYRGRLDESKKEAVSDARRELFEAMSAVAITGKGPEAQTASMGCSIKWR